MADAQNTEKATQLHCRAAHFRRLAVNSIIPAFAGSLQRQPRLWDRVGAQV
jgi:ATP-dependent protease HslVU (ClpYQ) peptidase subunit